MKLQELGLKSKPQTKYFEGGYVSFQTREGELYFKIKKVSKTVSGKIYQGKITSSIQLERLLNSKSLLNAVGALA